MDKWVILSVRESTKRRIFDECLPVFLEENPSMEKIMRLVKTHDFMINRLIEYYLQR